MAVARVERRAGGARATLEQVRELARDHNLIPLAETFIDDCQTPVSAFLKLRELPFDVREPAFLLESADQGRVGRYSFIGFKPRKIVRWSLGDPGDPYALAATELARYRVAELPVEVVPPTPNGGVGQQCTGVQSSGGDRYLRRGTACAERSRKSRVVDAPQ